MSILMAIRLPAELRDAAVAAGKERGLKLAQVMRLALAEWLQRQVEFRDAYKRDLPRNCMVCGRKNVRGTCECVAD